jgi:hypothetical protein
LNGATVQGRAIVVNKSEPKPEGERSFNNNSRGGDSRGGYGGGNSRGGENRGGGNRDINILFYNYKKKDNLNCHFF